MIKIRNNHPNNDKANSQLIQYNSKELSNNERPIEDDKNSDKYQNYINSEKKILVFLKRFLQIMNRILLMQKKILFQMNPHKRYKLIPNII